MKTYQACIPCIMDLMGTTLQNSDLDPSEHQAILDRIENDLINADRSLPPARNAGLAYQAILKETGTNDLFLIHKGTSLKAAVALYPRLKELVAGAPDPIDAAIRVSALGNILDVANPNNYDLDEEIEKLLTINLAGDSLDIFKEKLNTADSLLLLADNAAETIFDKVLIETLEIPVIYAVKSGPAFDDALFNDARDAGIDQVAEVIETGTPYPGTYLPSCTADFQQLYAQAPLVLAKGQANYETLNDADRDIFFLLKVKCDVVSKEIGYPLGSLVFQHKD